MKTLENFLKKREACCVAHDALACAFVRAAEAAYYTNDANWTAAVDDAVQAARALVYYDYAAAHCADASRARVVRAARVLVIYDNHIASAAADRAEFKIKTLDK